MFRRLRTPATSRHLLLRAGACLALSLAAGCYDRFDTPQPDGERLPVPNTTIATLRAYYAGTSFVVTNDLVIGGTVTADDRSGNFYRTIMVEADGAAVELLAGVDDLHRFAPVGTQVRINLKGLAIDESRGVLRIGAPSADGKTAEQIGSRPALDRSLFRSDDAAEVVAETRTLRELLPACCGRLIRVKGVRFAPEGIEERTWAGYKRFVDAEGSVVWSYTRLYADFAGHVVPSVETALTGILQYGYTGEGEPCYIIKMRDETDCSY